MGRTQRTRGASRVGDASGIVEVARAQGEVRVSRVVNRPNRDRVLVMGHEAEGDGTHVDCAAGRHCEASTLTP